MVGLSEAPPPIFIWLDFWRHPPPPRFSFGWTLRSLRFSYGWSPRSLPISVWLDFLRFYGIRMVVLSTSPVGLAEAFGFRMVGLLEVPRFSYSWTLKGLRISHGWTLRGSSVSYGCTLRGPPVFVWLDSQSAPGFRMVELFEASQFSCG